MEIDEDILEAAKRHERVLISSERNTTRFINKISNYLDNRLAPHITIHGVLVDVYGIGVLIKLDDDRLIGQAPELLRHYMEIRGIGIIDVRSLYGVGAIKNMKEISLILELESWDQEKYYDRLGLDKEYETILGKEVEKLVVPVKPGRNTAMIVEVAAMNYRQKIMGYDAAIEFTKKLSQTIQK